jgi:hypothetical protein
VLLVGSLQCIATFASVGFEVGTDGTTAPAGLAISMQNTHDFPVSVYYDDQSSSGIFMVRTDYDRACK